MKRLAAVLALGLGLGVMPASAQDTSAQPPARYTFNRVDDGFIRLDNSNGQVARCTRRATGYACEVVAEERQALESEIARLLEENAALKKQLAELTNPPPPRPPASVPPQASDKLKMPTEKDLERVKTFVGDTWRRVVDMIVGWQKDVMRRG